MAGNVYVMHRRSLTVDAADNSPRRAPHRPPANTGPTASSTKQSGRHHARHGTKPSKNRK